MAFVFIAKVQHFVELHKLFHYYKQKKTTNTAKLWHFEQTMNAQCP